MTDALLDRRRFSQLAFAAAAAASIGVLPRAVRAQPVEGRDFTRIANPQPQIGTSKVEVLEFFSYACPHCHAFEPALEAWARQLPKDVALRRVPVPFLYNFENFERTYYTLETLGAVDAMQLKVFRAIHVDKVKLDKPEEIAAFMGKNGVDEAKFLAAFKSFSVATSAARAKRLTADYGIDSVPMLAVQGRYLTSPSQAGDAPRALAVVDQLIQGVRKG